MTDPAIANGLLKAVLSEAIKTELISQQNALCSRKFRSGVLFLFPPVRCDI